MPQDLSAVGIVELPRHCRDDGEVVVAEGLTNVPFAIARMFTLRAPKGVERGRHAHRRCSQLMLCVNGTIDIVCDDGVSQRTFALMRNNEALLVPPMIWNTVIFRESDSVLVTLCDRLYEEHDYIRDYADFISARNPMKSS